MLQAEYSAPKGSAQHQVLSLREAKAWRQRLESLPRPMQDVYASPEYYSLYVSEHVQAECFVYEENGQVIVYPYLKSNINVLGLAELKGQFFDIEGVYGYNGLLSNTDDSAFFKGFSRAFAKYCEKANIVTEFARLNPIFFNENLRNHWDVRKVNKNVIVDLTQSEEDLWMRSYEHCVRKNVNKAKRSNLRVCFFYGGQLDEKHLRAFLKIYLSTMDRHETSGFYYFDKAYFEKLCRLLPRQSLFFFAFNGREAVSCELVLLSQENAYSFLGGTLADAQALRPNNILKHEIILTLKKMGFQKYCLGGGKTMDDGIFRYKRTFAKDGEVDFYIGKKVHNPKIYNRLCEQWTKKFPEKEKSFENYVLKYRY